MFKKIVAVEPVNITLDSKKELTDFAESVTLYEDIPKDDDEILRRIGDADAVLVSYTSRITGRVIEAAPKIRYIGMCCSLYAPENANVDILAAREKGIVVKGVRDYGDEGVPEYVISELVRLLHGFGKNMWKEIPVELTGIDVGILGMGTTGIAVARALRFFGANVYYYSRTKKEEVEKEYGLQWLAKDELLSKVEILCACLNKNVILMDEEAFGRFGNGKIYMNTSIGPGHDVEALEKWLENPDNYALSDTAAGLGPDKLRDLPNVICVNKSAGFSSLSRIRLGRKVIDNIKEFLEV